MDNFLADYFGTNQTAPEQVTETDELEKMAQLVMLDKIAANQGVDLSNLTDDEYVQLAQEVFESNGQEKVAEQQAQTQELTDLEKEAAVKFEESVYLGKVAAHALWNELNSIQQVAMEKEAADATTMQKIYRGVGKHFGKGKEKAKGLEKMVSGSGADHPLTQVAKRVADEAAESTGKKVVRGVAGTTLGLGATAGAIKGRKAKKEEASSDEGQSKESSAFSALSDARAYEILQQYGLADDQGNVVTPDQLQKYAEEQGQQEEKTAADRLAEAVELEAWEKLAALGYPVIDQNQQ